MTRPYTATKILLWLGALFFFVEFFFHAFGLPILDHDKIYLYTHDGYIALYGLTYAALLTLISFDLQKYKTLFVLTVVGMLFGMVNGYYIASRGGYSGIFPVPYLDKDLSVLGIFFLLWYLALLLAWHIKK